MDRRPSFNPIIWVFYFPLIILSIFTQPAQPQYIQDVQAVTIGSKRTAVWRASVADTPQPVSILKTAIVLEYNCHFMKAICKNAKNWIDNSPRSRARTLPTFASGANRFNLFAYDNSPLIGGTPKSPRYRRDSRGDNICPENWKRNHACPESDQPDIMPGPWPHKALETRHAIATNEIQGGTANFVVDPNDPTKSRWVLPHINRSGRYYTCEEFPARSWIEGGVGTPGQNVSPEGDGDAGNTYCAPKMLDCSAQKGPKTNKVTLPRTVAIWSEQDWQGSAHSILSARLKIAAQAERKWAVNKPVVFRLAFADNPNGKPAKVTWRDLSSPNGSSGQLLVKMNRGVRRSLNSSEPISDQDMLDYLAGLEAEDYSDWDSETVPFNATDTSTDSIPLPGDAALGLSLFSSNETMLDEEAESSVVDGMSDSLGRRADSAGNVTVDLAGTVPLRAGTHQVPEMRTSKKIDILEVGKRYILESIGTNSSGAADIENSNANVVKNHAKRHSHSRRSWRHRHGASKYRPSHDQRTDEKAEKPRNVTPYTPLHKRDGPIQCGPGSPCIDDSCCNTDGKCGFKEAHCGAGNCISDCEAKAMCGIDSADGQTRCGLNLCCSYYGWCGTEEVHCHDPEPQYGLTPCQSEFGSCTIYDPPSCSPSSGTASKRKVAYYQGWNVRERQCDRVRPSQINTRGLTHLFFAFLFFDPVTFEVTPMNEGDVSLYGEFTSLARNGLQTWIAIGGWSFSDPGIYRHAWSDMVSTAANRAKFINSLIRFMDKYGFQGADLDWEYPASEDRGGRKEDSDNLVSLIKEMHAAFAGRYGLSLVLAPDYWYLRGFKPGEMQDYVDFMGFMAYDLHGPWDSDVEALGSKVRPHTDITEIEKNLRPLWFDQVDPSKINLGLAYYGRTYKLSDPSCGSMGCGFVSEVAGAPGQCTAFSGVLSNREIKAMIDNQQYTTPPYFNETAMVKYFTYDTDSWVGYDDEETMAAKEAYANSRCLGGTMIWSIDFDPETGGGGSANEHISPEDATIIPMSHTTVASGATFTLNSAAATDIVELPYDGNQNNPIGPGGAQCSRCSFFRRITSTCCGFGGSIGNPIVIPANFALPVDIPLPPGFTPNQEFVDCDDKVYPADTPLPREVYLCAGNVFSVPFIIPAGQPLKNGEADDEATEDGNLIWIDPKIWDEENPEVQCYFPCTIMLPPYPKETRTIDYPRITVSTGTWTITVTAPPITVTEWHLERVIVGEDEDDDDDDDDDDSSSKKSIRTVTPKHTSTLSWPTVYYTKTDGDSEPITPPTPTPPPPPRPPVDPPPVTVRNRGPPGPLTKSWDPPCLICPPPIGTNNGFFGKDGTDPDEEGDEGDEDEFEEDEVCMLDDDEEGGDNGGDGGDDGGDNGGGDNGGGDNGGGDNGGGDNGGGDNGGGDNGGGDNGGGDNGGGDNGGGDNGGGDNGGGDNGGGDNGGGDSGGDGSIPPQTPDKSQNRVECYNSGTTTHRLKLLQAATRFCLMHNFFGLGYFSEGRIARLEVPFAYDEVEGGAVTVTLSLEAKSGCAWLLNLNECTEQFMKIVDDCNTNTQSKKQGGTMENNCLKWRIDPNGNTSPAPPPSPPASPPLPPDNRPPIKDGNKPRFLMMSTSYAGAGPTPMWYHEIMGFSTYTPLNPCRASGGWSKSVSRSDQPDDEIKDITQVHGDTCTYKSNGVDYLDAPNGAVVGKLECKKHDDAECKKSDEEFRCGSVLLGNWIFALLVCRWYD